MAKTGLMAKMVLTVKMESMAKMVKTVLTG